MEKLLIILLMLVVSCLGATPTARKITIVNQCTEDFYINVVSGAALYASTSISVCRNDADCSTGSYCLVEAGICFYKVPTPQSGQFFVSAGKSNYLSFPYYNNADRSHWAGNFAFCSGNMTCSDTPPTCKAKGCGVYAGPFNQAEINLAKSDTDFYDVSNIGGINVPMAFAPDTANPAFSGTDPYRCGSPGAPSPVTRLGASQWNPVVPSVYYQWVKPSNTLCAKDSDCPAGNVCGLSNQPGATPQWKLNCGRKIGYWTANAVCAQDPNNLLQTGPFQCSQTINNGPITTTIGQLQGCNGATGSGYSQGADPYVCGCQDWYKLLGADAVPQTTENCTNSNPLWISNILPTLTWVKRVCPSCYTYPYDDQSSTFVCQNVQNGYNIQNYTITLCPANIPIQTTPSPTSQPTAQPTGTPQPTAQATQPSGTPRPTTPICITPP